MKTILITTLLTLTLAATVSTVQAGLIGHYTFDNASDLGADSSGAGNSALSLNAVNYSSDGVYGGSASFTASAQSYLRWAGLTDAIANVVGGDFSFSVWIKTTQAIGLDTAPGFAGRGIIYSDIRSDHNDTIPLALTGSKAAFFTGVSYLGDTIHSTSSVNNGEWVHIVVSRDLETGAKALYVNGVLEANTIHEPGIPLNEKHELFVGGNISDNAYFTGLLDDLRVFDSVVTPSGIDGGFSAVPEPSTALFGGLALLGATLRRRR